MLVALALLASLAPVPARSEGIRSFWIARSTGAGGAVSATLAPDRTKLFVTGGETSAYDAATGATAWRDSSSGGKGIVTSPDGKLVFTITTTRTTSPIDMLTVARDSATGVVAWTAVYNHVDLDQFGQLSPAGDDKGVDIGRSADGRLVFVTGSSDRRLPGYPYTRFTDIVTIAYDASNGAQRWLCAGRRPTPQDRRLLPSAAMAPCSSPVVRKRPEQVATR